MVKTKEELTAIVDKTQKEQIAQLVEKIDKELEKNYTPGDRVTIYLPREPILHKKVIEEIKRLYKETGWTVIFDGNQRDGDYIMLF